MIVLNKTYHIKHYLLIVFCSLFSIVTFSQNLSNEQIKRVQRAIYIFNFSQQVSWSNLEDLETFNIGVLGKDRTLIDLKSLALKRKIYNKPVNVIGFNAVKDVKNIQVLYLKYNNNYDLNYVLKSIENKNILLITEDSKYNSSMINMVNVDNTFEYEINKSLLYNSGFRIAPSLETNAITSSEKWKLLYKDTASELKTSEEIITQKTNQLNTTKAELNDKEAVIEQQNQQLSNTNLQLQSSNKWISKLKEENALQDQKLDQKIEIEKQLEQFINAQLDTINNQQIAISNSKLEIDKQAAYIKNQLQEIEDKQKIIEENDDYIFILKMFNYLLAALVFITLVASIIIFKNYRAKKKLNQILTEKNKIIYKQTQQLTSKNKELEQFAYITSHDLKEPLNTISGLIGLLLEDHKDQLDQDGITSLNYINQSSIRMKSLIDALLDYSRLGKSQQFEYIDANVIINTVKADLGNRILNSKAQIISEHLPEIYGSEVELRLLFQNLISNGIKFIKPNTTPIINISAEEFKNSENDLFIKFAVKDNGIGIPKKHQERIFAIFQRLHNRDEYEGTGIGLSHCKKIVESHGGTIWLESEPNQGTTFYFTLPKNNL